MKLIKMKLKLKIRPKPITETKLKQKPIFETKLKQKLKPIIFCAFFRDLAPHYKTETSNVTEELVLEITQNITDLLLDVFPDVPILPVIGNHDYFPKNELTGSRTPMYENLGDIWEPLFHDEEVVEKFKEGM